MPVTIPPGEMRSITVVANLPKQAGMFSRTLALVVEDGGLRNMSVRVIGRIRAVEQ